ncbi:hypothetical protein [Pelagibacterium lacus]|uniref:hypothetical protein n=1 Tax=Pelagibacterium lacus TaxID=2282655 RepID=UPI0011C02455|nr:hypothetical protein [Pelagibacterium lacus]
MPIALDSSSESARVAICVKDLKSHLETEQPLERSKILAMAHIFRRDLFGPDVAPMEMLDRPFSFDRQTAASVYGVLEQLRNTNLRQMESTRKSLARMDMPLPDFILSHVRTSARALEVWMVTVGVGISPDMRADVRAIWGHLEGASPVLPVAFAALRAFADANEEVTGIRGKALFNSLDDGLWAEACRYIPAFTRARISTQ